jgi:pSer/pThr/pTyr-binding forkhead associated (FHA) protein
MKYNFICEGGRHDNFFSDKSNPPEECQSCFEKFDLKNVVETEDQNQKDPVSLTIIYQLTQERLEIPNVQKTLLGRNNTGSEIFSKIRSNGKPVISREHCSIEYKNGKFYLLDEESMNGTFYGVNKITCKNCAQLIENNSVFYIGEEQFLAILNYGEEVKSEVIDAPPRIRENTIPKSFRCSKCGTEFEVKTEDCPNCERYNTLIPIYE